MVVQYDTVILVQLIFTWVCSSQLDPPIMVCLLMRVPCHVCVGVSVCTHRRASRQLRFVGATQLTRVLQYCTADLV